MTSTSECGVRPIHHERKLITPRPRRFLWMIRISGGIWPDEIREVDYFTPRGEYRIDDAASQTMKDSLMYKM